MTIPNFDVTQQILDQPAFVMKLKSDSTYTRSFDQVIHPFETYQDEYLYAMSSDWDGEGSKPVTESVVKLAEDLFNKYASHESLLGITPGKDGSLSFLWDDNSGNYVYLDIGPNQTIHLYYDVIDGGRWEGVSVADDPAIQTYLKKAFKCLAPKIAKSFEQIAISEKTGKTTFFCVPAYCKQSIL